MKVFVLSSAGFEQNCKCKSFYLNKLDTSADLFSAESREDESQSFRNEMYTHSGSKHCHWMFRTYVDES